MLSGRAVHLNLYTRYTMSELQENHATPSSPQQAGGTQDNARPVSGRPSSSSTPFQDRGLHPRWRIAMIPIIESEVVDKHGGWRRRFLDLIAVAQSCPGVFAINISTSLATSSRGAWCRMHHRWHRPAFLSHHPAHCHVLPSVHERGMDCRLFRGIRPAVVALIAVPTFNWPRAHTSTCPTAGSPSSQPSSSGPCTSIPSGSSSPQA